MKIIIFLGILILSSGLALAKGGLSLAGTISEVTTTDNALSFTFTGTVSLYIYPGQNPDKQPQTVKWAVTAMPFTARRWTVPPSVYDMKPEDNPYAITFPNAVLRVQEAKSDLPLSISVDEPTIALNFDGGLAKIDGKRIFIHPKQ
jgi:hypothetical protein